MSSGSWSPKQRSAIFAAGSARGLDADAIRAIAQERLGVERLSRLSREQAHQLLDILNGKDPEKESHRRNWIAGKARRGEHAWRSPAPEVGPASAGGNKEKVLRPASDEQWGLVRSLAFRCGLTTPDVAGDSNVLSLDALRRWMEWKFGQAWSEVGRGEATRRVMAGSLARSAIHALRDWEKWRLKKWLPLGRDVANAVLAAGLSNGWDKRVPANVAGLPEAVLKLLGDGAEAKE